VANAVFDVSAMAVPPNSSGNSLQKKGVPWSKAKKSRNSCQKK